MRCPWSVGDVLYEKYHDEEWGVPVYDDKVHFEFLVLESAQAGLSWRTILNKRGNYREAYDGFDYEKVSCYDEKKVAELLTNKGLVRNRKKIEASIVNAKVFKVIREEFGSFSTYIWRFVDNKPVLNYFKESSEVPAITELAERVSKDLRKRGMKFLGPTTIYAHLQATGIVNDHLITCPRHIEVQKFAR